METASIAKTLDGESLYQQRARLALPILVRQAHAGSKIYYADLAAELAMSNPRTLNYPLGSIGSALQSLSKEWNEDIPQIQCIVVNQATGLPGEGISGFVRDLAEFRSLLPRQREALVEGVLARIFAYPRWNEVLEHFGLQPAASQYTPLLKMASKRGTTGESPFHQALKKYVSDNPEKIGLSRRAAPGEVEFGLPSGDCVDVFFSHASVRTAVEVKSRISDTADLVRGIFQCVKYRAVLAAYIAAQNSRDSAQAILVLETELPPELRQLRTILDVPVVENLVVPAED